MNERMPPEFRAAHAAFATEQFGPADRPESVPEQEVGFSVGGRQAAVPDRQIRLAGLEAQDAVGADDVQRRTGLGLPPARKPRHQPAACERVRRRDAKRLGFAIAPDARNRRRE